MAGHSKWANIKHKKALSDRKKGKLFSRIIREITVSARFGSDLNSNFRLRQAIDKAKEANIAKDTIQKAITQSDKNSDNLEEIVYEGYICGVAVMVKCFTENKNRTVANVRHAFSKRGGTLGNSGSVGYLFRQKGHFVFPPCSNEVTEFLLNITAEYPESTMDIDNGEYIEIFCLPQDYYVLYKVWQDKNILPDLSEISIFSDDKLEVSEKEEILIKSLIEALMDLDDVENIYTNLDWKFQEV